MLLASTWKICKIFIRYTLLNQWLTLTQLQYNDRPLLKAKLYCTKQTKTTAFHFAAIQTTHTSDATTLHANQQINKHTRTHVNPSKYSVRVCTVVGRHSVFSSNTRYLSDPKRWLQKSLFFYFGCSTPMSIACLLYWYCNNLQALSEWYCGTFSAMLRYWYLYKKYRHFCIAI